MNALKDFLKRDGAAIQRAYDEGLREIMHNESRVLYLPLLLEGVNALKEYDEENEKQAIQTLNNVLQMSAHITALTNGNEAMQARIAALDSQVKDLEQKKERAYISTIRRLEDELQEAIRQRDDLHSAKIVEMRAQNDLLNNKYSAALSKLEQVRQVWIEYENMHTQHGMKASDLIDRLTRA